MSFAMFYLLEVTSREASFLIHLRSLGPQSTLCPRGAINVISG
jgi:hypothetical protein